MNLLLVIQMILTNFIVHSLGNELLPRTCFAPVVCSTGENSVHDWQQVYPPLDCSRNTKAFSNTTNVYGIADDERGHEGQELSRKKVDPGLDGTPGSKGQKGDRGSKGDAGLKGEKGSPGSGSTGVPGSAGEKGSIGPSGIRGQKGEDGERGDIGLRGQKGEQGLPGPAGIRGPKGDPGAKGNTGNQGQLGIKGDAGSKGEPGSPGQHGMKGAEGPKGPPGFKGDNGQKGSQGISGSRGLSGLKGEKGNSGSAGPVGPVGPKGNSGVAGISGQPGMPGIKGEPGRFIRGPPGEKGDMGQPGPPLGRTIGGTNMNPCSFPSRSGRAIRFSEEDQLMPPPLMPCRRRRRAIEEGKDDMIDRFFIEILINKGLQELRDQFVQVIRSTCGLTYEEKCFFIIWNRKNEKKTLCESQFAIPGAVYSGEHLKQMQTHFRLSKSKTGIYIESGMSYDIEGNSIFNHDGSKATYTQWTLKPPTSSTSKLYFVLDENVEGLHDNLPEISRSGVLCEI